MDKMDLQNLNQELFKFLDASPTPFHAVQAQISLLESYGFQPLSEADAWNLIINGGMLVYKSLLVLVADKQANV